MQQALHLLIVDVQSSKALATWHGSRWLLPVLFVPERARAGPLVLEWTTARGISGPVVGQWLGRAAIAHDAVDWLVVVSASLRTPETAPSSTLRWTPLQSLRTASCVLDYQQWAVEHVTSAGELPAVAGPFGSVSWLDEVQAWVGQSISCTRPYARIVPHRIGAYEVVLELAGGQRRLYFKGLSADRAAEVTITLELSAVAPDSFPETVALASRPDGTVWWLMDACRGMPLAQRLTPQHAARVVVAYALLQQRLASHVRNGCLKSIPTLDLARLARWGAELFSDVAEDMLLPTAAAVVEDACQCVAQMNMPHSWLASDLDPTNVLIDNDQVRFIDLDDALLGPAPLALATFARRLSRLWSGSSAAAESTRDVYEAYDRAWDPPLLAQKQWPVFGTVSSLLESYLNWERLLAKTRRGEIFDLVEPARVVLRERLRRVLHGGPNALS